MIITKKIEVDVPDMHKRIRAFLDTVDGVTAKLIKSGLNPQTVYTFTKEGVNASYWQLDRYLKPLGSSVEALGVVFPSEAQKPLPIEQAPVGEDLLCYRKVDKQWLFCGIWFYAKDTGRPDGWYRERVWDLPDDVWWEIEDKIRPLDNWVPMQITPDGFLPLPILAEEEDDA